MEATLNALGGILLRALPTFFLVLFLHFYLKKMFFQPLERVLAERRAATEGAREAAEASLAKAGALAAQYEEALRTARAEIGKQNEDLRQKLLEEQVQAIEAARAQARAAVEAARAEIAREAEAARAGLRAESEALAAQIASRVLAGRAA